uniref:NOT2_3_5 domain-containing protein n=1 Tax=Parastrongyloides trichosuri TaxID=131310 RepID=A0A0N4Z7S6_PARTI
MSGKQKEFKIGDEDFPALGNVYPKTNSNNAVIADKLRQNHGEQNHVNKSETLCQKSDDTSNLKESFKGLNLNITSSLLKNYMEVILGQKKDSSSSSSSNSNQSINNNVNIVNDSFKKLILSDNNDEECEDVSSDYPCAKLYRKLVAKELSQAGFDATKILENRIEDDLIGSAGGSFEIPDFCLENGICPYGLVAFKNFYDHMQQNKEKFMSYCYKDDLSTLIDIYSPKDRKLYEEVGSIMSSNNLTPINHSVRIPLEYMISRNVPITKFPPTALSYDKLGLDTLFYIFFNCIGDNMQIGAAYELIKREWVFHNSLKTWITPVYTDPTSANNKCTDTYRIFNVLKWMEEVVTMTIDYPTDIETSSLTTPLPEIVIKYLKKKYPNHGNEAADPLAKEKYEEELIKQEKQWEKLFCSTWLRYLNAREADSISVRYLFQFCDSDVIETMIMDVKTKDDIPAKIDSKEKNSLHNTVTRYRESMTEKPISRKVLHEAVMKACSNQQQMGNFSGLPFDNVKMPNVPTEQKIEAIPLNPYQGPNSIYRPPIPDMTRYEAKVPRHMIPPNDQRLADLRETINYTYNLNLTQEEFYKVFLNANDFGAEIKKLKQEKEALQQQLQVLKPDSQFDNNSLTNSRNVYDDTRIQNSQINGGIHPYADMVSRIAARHQQQMKAEGNPALQQQQPNIDVSLMHQTQNANNIAISQQMRRDPADMSPLKDQITMMNEMMLRRHSQLNPQLLQQQSRPNPGNINQNGVSFPANPQLLNRMMNNNSISIQTTNYPTVLNQSSPQGSQQNCNTLLQNPGMPPMPPQGFQYGQMNMPNYGMPMPSIPINPNSMGYSRSNFGMLPGMNFGNVPPNFIGQGRSISQAPNNMFDSFENRIDTNGTGNNPPYYSTEN